MEEEDTSPCEDPEWDNLDWLFDKMWHDKYGAITRDELSRQICLEKTIKNDTAQYETELSWRILDFSCRNGYPVYCRGLVEGVYVIYKVNILAAINKGLAGPHYVQIEDDEPFWVHSLTALRKKFLKFEDYVSFERSSFLTFEFEYLTAVRIKMLRQIIQIPIETPNDRIFISPERCYDYTNTTTKIQTTELSPRSKLQIKRLIFNIQQIYFRDKGVTPTNTDINTLINSNI
jgi:hypothetical protein